MPAAATREAVGTVRSSGPAVVVSPIVTATHLLGTDFQDGHV
jgi:hypothetical protein